MSNWDFRTNETLLCEIYVIVDCHGDYTPACRSGSPDNWTPEESDDQRSIVRMDVSDLEGAMTPITHRGTRGWFLPETIANDLLSQISLDELIG